MRHDIERRAARRPDADLRPRLVPFAPAHLAALSPRAFERLTFGLQGGHDRETAARLAALGPAFSLLRGREMVACAGIMLGPVRPDGTRAGDAWALTGEAVERFPLAFHRAVRRTLGALVAGHGLSRVQALCLAGHARSRRWLNRLGFRRETLEPGMACMLPGARLHLYALTREDES